MGPRNRIDVLYSVAHYYALSPRCVTHAQWPVRMDHVSLRIRVMQRETQWVHLLNASKEKYTAAGYPNILHWDSYDR